MIREVRAMLFAWQKFGYAAAELEHNLKYSGKTKPVNLDAVIRGKIAFVRYTRGADDSLTKKLATKFNSLTSGSKIRTALNDEERALSATWVLESEHEQGTAFFLKGFGLVTCAHCVGKEMKIWHPSNSGNHLDVTVEKIDVDLDLAILSTPAELSAQPSLSPRTIALPDQSPISLIGYPNHAVWKTVRLESGQKIREFPVSGVRMMEITPKIIEGNSGGPILDSGYAVVGVAVRRKNSATKIEHVECLGVKIQELNNLSAD
jgi:RNA-directed DNA polymerase